MEIYLSDGSHDFTRSDRGFYRDPKAEMELVVCRPDITYQEITGFGGAFTEAAAYTFAQMPAALQDEFLQLCFTADLQHPERGGNGYTMGRTPIQSCDFALDNYSYVSSGVKSALARGKGGVCRASDGSQPTDKDASVQSENVVAWTTEPSEKDAKSATDVGEIVVGNASASVKKTVQNVLKTFSIDRDRELLLPFIQCAQLIAPKLDLIATPWSPPAFMKTNLNMNYGGHLRQKYYAHWAAVEAAYLKAYADEGVEISRLTVQNEPSAAQSWDSCVFNPKQEAVYARDYLRPALDAAGFGDVRLLMWDHNKDQVFDRVESVLTNAGDGVFDGVAFHWYAGDHFDGVAEVARQFPALELIATEGCEEYLRDLFIYGPNEGPSERATVGGIGHAYHYAHDILGDLRAGATAFLDWNVLLDEQGGPNHAKNYCEAPIMYHRERQELVVNRSFGAIGHFSRFIQPGARRFFTSSYSARFECGGFVNPDRSRVLVVVNGGDADTGFKLFERPWAVRVDVPTHAVMTLRWTPAEVGHDS